jgi:hypothetical protein
VNARCALVLFALMSTMTLAAETTSRWVDVVDPALTPDGQWFVYALMPRQTGDVEIVVRSTTGEQVRRYPAGAKTPEVGNPRLSPSGRWLAYQFIKAVGQESATRLVRLSDGETADFPRVQRFEFIGNLTDAERLLLHRSNELEVRHLTTGEGRMIADVVSAFSF